MKKHSSNILLIYTGGTIGMIKDFETGSLKNFNFDELLQHVPELNLLDCVIDTHSFETPIDSSNMNPDCWEQLVGIIENRYEEFDGFVILHGSDTMSYTASAVSFMLENLAKPVIFTGSQLPIGDLRTDAKENLITSIQLAALRENNEPVVKEVGLYFEYKLYRANRTTKINAEHFEAFASLNYPALAESGVYLAIEHRALLKVDTTRIFKTYTKMEDNVFVLKMFPGINQATIHHLFAAPNLKGLILETYGSGNLTTETWFLKALKKLIDKDIPIINVTQCSGGSVEMGNYETSVALKKMGVISGKDSTTEAAVTKLMFLLANRKQDVGFKEQFETSLRGEIS
ncbi:MAG: L-asparaginase [Patiriisocius sp.]|jgi:L-asparaginase